MQLNRRTALRLGVAGGAMAALGPATRVAWAAAPTNNARRLEPDAGGWSTWVLQSGSELRPVAPPEGGTTRSELDALRALAAQRDQTALDQISYWDTGAPGYRWNEIAIAQGLKEGITIAVYRVLALVNVAIYDATVAAWDAKYRYNRLRPSEADPSLTTVVTVLHGPGGRSRPIAPIRRGGVPQ